MSRRTPDPIAVAMRAARQRRGWSLEKAGQELAIEPIVIGSYERGDRQPGLDKLRRWVEAMGYELVVASEVPRTANGTSWFEHAVRPPVGALVICDSAAEAFEYAATWPGAQTVEREVYASPWRQAWSDDVTPGGGSDG